MIPKPEAFGWRVLAAVVLSAVFAVLFIGWHQAYLQGAEVDRTKVIVIDNMTRKVQPNQSSPDNSDDSDKPENWRNTPLPDDWLLNGYQQSTEWYRHELHLNVPPDRLWGVMLTAVNLNAAVYLNDSLVGVQGRMEEPIAHNWNQPLHFSIPSGMLRTGTNKLEIKVVSNPPGHGFLGPVYLGPREALLPSYDRLSFLNIQLSRFVSGISFILAAVIFGIWLMRRDETEYGWFALTVFLWSLHSLKFHLSAVPVASYYWAWWLYMTSISVSYAFFFFVSRFRGMQNNRLDITLYAMWATSIALITVPMLLGSMWFYDVSQIVYALGFIVAVSGFSCVVKHTLETRSSEAYWLALAISFLVVVVVYDITMIYGLTNRTHGQLVIYAVPVLLGAFSVVLLKRFDQALTERRELMTNLEARAEAAAARIVELETSSALAHQRETIMRDMHDGVGGQLVSSLALLERTDGSTVALLKEVLQRALLDLRLMIDSLDTDTGDLNLLIGALRDRMQPLLNSAGFTTTWALAEISSQTKLDPHNALQILRILQEALANVIKHAKASHICIEMKRVDEQQITLQVTDDGIGLPNALSGKGRGMLNMQRRADELGATLLLTSGPNGAGLQVTLTLMHY